MKSKWSHSSAARVVRGYRKWGKDLALRTYSARLLGGNPDLVLHGGGNTSVKIQKKLGAGRILPVLYVKGSGLDLGVIEPLGHPGVRLEPLLGLRNKNAMFDQALMTKLKSSMLDPSGPSPSVETLVHAFLPHKYVDHTHADAVLAVVDQSDGFSRAKEVAAGRLAVIPYVMSGLPLARSVAQAFELDTSVEGVVLLKHGIVTFGSTAQESYERMIQWVSRFEGYVKKHKTFMYVPKVRSKRADSDTLAMAAHVLRSAIRFENRLGGPASEGQSMIVRHRSSAGILNFVNSRQAAALSKAGPATPDHVIRIKPFALLLEPTKNGDQKAFESEVKTGVTAYNRQYQSYFKTQCAAKKVKKKPLDSMPRLILVPCMGLFAAAPNAKECDMALDIYEHTIGIMRKSSSLGPYRPLSRSHLFDMEYWSLEQAKLKGGIYRPMDGKIVWISGAASGIGLATSRAFLDQGAHVYLTDLNRAGLKKALASLGGGSRAASSPCDVTNAAKVKKSFQQCSRMFGGVDVIVSNAGAAFSGSVDKVSDKLFRRSFELNFFSHLNVVRAGSEILRRQKQGGVFLFNASKSAFSPGPDFGPYTIPKAGVIALMRQTAVDLGKYGIRANAVNADRVRTRLFSGGFLESRAKARGMSVKKYLSGNLLGKEVYADDVADAFVYLAGAMKTTGAVIPVDGGNAAVFPR